ncbi:MAG: 3D-(3,5/4)-trihydroxycyclohexane-1,2-dione acylhydrolase (decyclizing), partial [Promethearchaeota archaeon]
ALSAKSYGAEAITVNSLDELEGAFKKAREADKTILIHIKIKEFSQTGGYGGAWWRVGIAEVSTMPTVQKARKELEENMKKARKY